METELLKWTLILAPALVAGVVAGASNVKMRKAVVTCGLFWAAWWAFSYHVIAEVVR